MQEAQRGDKMALTDTDAFRHALLAWYDGHRRSLPWRAPSGRQADPYYVWLSEIMLQQTVVATVIPYFLKFVDKWPTVHDLARADIHDVMEAWAGLGYYARARNLHKCAQIVSTDYSGTFPDSQEELKKLPGIGDYTSAAITAIAFDKPAVVIDGNVDRVIARYFAVTTPLPDAKPDIRILAASLAESRTDRPGDFAQAMMDLGATVCIAKAPRCLLCPLQDGCLGYREGIQGELPRKRRKKQKPYKYGYIYWIKDGQGRVLVERRPENAMLGRMLGLPTSDWNIDKSQLAAPDFLKSWPKPLTTGLKVYHSFTHFDLELDGYIIDLNGESVDVPNHIQWIDDKTIHSTGFPSLFKKFVRLMLQDNP